MTEQNDAERVPNTDPSQNLKGFIQGDSLSALILGRLGLQSTPLTPETPLQELLESLESPVWTVRVAAARVLGQVKNEEVVNYLVTALWDVKDAVRAAAVRSLGEFGAVAPVDPLLIVLKDESWEVRADAIEAIGKLKERAPITPFEDALRDEDETVRLAAVQACRHLGKRAPIEALIQALRLDASSSVREAIMLLLVELGEQEQLLSLLAEEIEDPALFQLVNFVLLQPRSQPVPESAGESLFALNDFQEACFDGERSVVPPPPPPPPPFFPTVVPRATIQIPREEKGKQKSPTFSLSAPFQEEDAKPRPPIREAAFQANPWKVDRVGERLGSYELLRVLGQGSSSTVYLGRHVLLEKTVAIKVLRPSAEASQFLQEARMLARIRHPNIISFLDYGIENDVTYAVMEYIPQGDLRQLYRAGMQFELAQVVSYISQVSAALEYLHEHGIVHCDVKPGNLLLDNSGEVLLCDFGIATTLSDTTTYITRPVIGTPPYMAPEQFQGRPIKASDQYSLAITAWEWLTGRNPFQGDMQSLMFQHLEMEPPTFNGKGAWVPRAVEEVLRKALRKDPSQRYSSIKAFAHALEVASKEEHSREIKPVASLQKDLSASGERAQTIHISSPVSKGSLEGLSEQEKMIWRMRWLFAIVISVGFFASGALSIVAFVSTGNLLTLGVIPTLIVVFRPATSYLFPQEEKHWQLDTRKQQKDVQKKIPMQEDTFYPQDSRPRIGRFAK